MHTFDYPDQGSGMSKWYRIEACEIAGIEGNNDEYIFEDISGKMSIADVRAQAENYWINRGGAARSIRVIPQDEVYETLSDDDSLRLK